LDDKSTRFVSSRIHNFSHLESIEIYTVRDNVNLVDVLKAMESSSEKLPDEKDNAALKTYFSKVYPDLDFDRVYSSDLKKMVKWFTVLKNNDVEIKLTEVEEEAVEEPVEAEAAAPAPAAKTAGKTKKTEAEEEPVTGKAAKAKKPATTKKKEEEEAPAKEARKKPAAKASAAKAGKEAAGKPKKTTKKK